MMALDFDTTVWIMGFVCSMFALAGLLMARPAQGALPAVSRMTFANGALALSVFGRLWAGDEMINSYYAAMWALWIGTLLALVSALRYAVDQPNADRKLLIGWILSSAALVAAAMIFDSPQPTAVVSCIGVFLAGGAGCVRAWTIRRPALKVPRMVLIIAFAAVAFGGLWHLPLRVADFLSGKPTIEQTAYTYVMLLGSWLTVNIGLIMIQYARVIESVGSLAHTDQLTGLLNRHGLRASLREYRRQHDRLMQGAVIMVDIDHFKRINDRHGHAVGDSVLSNLSALLPRFIRKEDLLVRWGGEEFCLIMPDSDVDSASLVAEEIRQGIEGYAMPGSDNLKLTASLGVASLGRQEAKLKEDLRRADEALFAAKRKGRNQVQRWSQEETFAIHPLNPDERDEVVSLT